MKYIWQRFPLNILTYIIESYWGTVISIRYNHPVLNQKSTNLTAYAVGIICPYSGHFKVTPVELKLFFGTHSYFLAGIHTNFS